MIEETPFTTGGPVHTDDEKIYISRKADQQLLKYCLEGEYSVILTARQMGKTSLLFHTIKELKLNDIATVYIDLNKIGTGGVSADDWFKSIMDIIREDLNLDIDTEAFWNNSNNLSHGLRLSKFMRDVALKSVSKQIIIFVDEVELTTQLEYSDSFFSTIRSLYTERSTSPEFKRLNFVLVGMARISDLIKQSDITTFNIGKRIDLENFTQFEIAPLIKIIPHQVEKSDLVSGWVLKWTGGQPFLTQILCEYLSLNETQIESEDQIDRIALELIERPDLQDKHINTIQRYLISKPSVNLILGIYALVLIGKSIPDFSSSITAIQYAKLAGVFVVQDGHLIINNKIYSQVFNLEWVEKQLKRVHTSLDVAIDIAKRTIESVSATTDLNVQLFSINEEADKVLENISIDAEKKDENSNRIFLIATGILGGVILISIACLVGVYLFGAGSQPPTTPLIVTTPDTQTLSTSSGASYIIIIGGIMLIITMIIGVVVSTNSELNNKENAIKNSISMDDEKRKEEEKEFLELWQKKARQWTWLDRISIYLAQADLKFKVAEIFALLLITTLGVGILLSALHDFDITFLIIGSGLGLCIPLIYINFLKEKRLTDFNNFLPETLYILTNGIKSGYSVFQAIESVASSIPGVIQDEFNRVLWEIKIEIEQSRAYAHMLERIPSVELSAIVGLLNLHREIGIRLVDIFDTIRSRVNKKQKAVLPHLDFLQFYILLFFEYFLVFIIANKYISAALSTPIGNSLLVSNLIALSFIAVIIEKKETKNNLLFAVVMGGLFFLLPWTEISSFHVAVVIFAVLNSTLIYGLQAELLISKDRILFFVLTLILFLILSLSQATSLGNASYTSVRVNTVLAIVVGIVILVSALSLIVVGLRYGILDGQEDDERAYREYYRGKVLTLEEFELSRPFTERIIISIIKRIGEVSASFTPEYVLKNTDRKLRESNYPGRIDASTFLASKFVTASILGGGVLLFLTYFQYLSFDYLFELVIFFSLIGFALPNVWLERVLKNRKETIENELPYAINLLWSCSDVGLSLSGSIKAVFEAWDSNVALEFGRVTREIQLGKGVREALTDMAIRVNVPQLSSLVTVLVQGDYLGVPLSSTLHTFYEQMMATQDADKKLDQVSIFAAIGLSIVLWIGILVLGQTLLIK